VPSGDARVDRGARHWVRCRTVPLKTRKSRLAEDRQSRSLKTH
jgi:hypothetical protein